MRKYLLHILIISVVFLLASTAQAASYEDEKRLEDAKEEVRKNPDDAYAHFLLGVAYIGIKDRDSALEQYRILKRLNSDEKANFLFNGINNYSQR